MLLQGLRADAVAAVAEIRRLVYDMRPPALDELGLVPRSGSGPRGSRRRPAKPSGSMSRPPRLMPHLPGRGGDGGLPDQPGSPDQRRPAQRLRHREPADRVDGDRLHIAVADTGANCRPWARASG